jgi:hypothetical protein
LMAPSLARKIMLQRAAALYEDGRHAVATEILRQLTIDSEDYLRQQRRAAPDMHGRLLHQKTVERLTALSTGAESQ